MPLPLSELTPLLQRTAALASPLPTPPNEGGKPEAAPAGKRYTLMAHSADQLWQTTVSRRHLRPAVGAALRWLRQHRSADGWRLACWAPTPRGQHCLAQWHGHPSFDSLLHDDSLVHDDQADGKQANSEHPKPSHGRARRRPFTWLSAAARHSSAFVCARHRGPERSLGHLKWPKPKR